MKLIYEINKTLWNGIINIIGEDYLKNTLKNHINDIENKLYSKIDIEILDMEKKINELKIKRDEQNRIS
ncbi:hypothetical protein MTQ00_02700 [Chryseobacterium sp. B21-037]|uniref:hypothetical protein n=1 Tax=Chryseobacterium sp. B21-037 TaxID=2926038 RepID=UPI002358C1EC|nr:hypothetical protein [Chryseobacterium sp. B21-037]MDC8103438.1 hypothetical protein [Chryseobacterium sp. B21-037]